MEQAAQAGPHVVVIGASFAGSFATAAAAAAGARVTLLDGDHLPPAPAPRPGVPQSRQAHVFLHRGLLSAQELLPGLRRDLLDRGAVPVQTGRLPWLGDHGWSPIGDHGHEVLSTSRPLLEHVVRTRALALDGVRLRDGTRVTGLRRNGSGDPGSRWSVRAADGDEIGADVVVDASGRGSRLPHWLADLGVRPAAVARVDARIGYATRRYTGGSGSAVVVQASPRNPRGGLVLPVEDGQWLISAVGTGDERPPREADAFTAFLDGMADPALAVQARRWSPCGEVALHRQTGNVRHEYQRVRDWPAGLLVVGDALCAFNPVYGQGITVAACQATVLRAGLTTRLDARGTRRLQRRLARATTVPWAIATGEDLRFPTSEGAPGRVQDLFSRWGGTVQRLAVDGDERAARTLGRTYHLLGSPLELLHPALLASALRPRHPRPSPRPAALEELDHRVGDRTGGPVRSAADPASATRP